MMTLIVREAGKPERAVQTSRSFVKLGRAEAMVHVHVTDPGAGKVHAVLERDGKGEVWVIDLGTRIGTMLNDVPVKKGLLKDGDVLSVGATRVEVVLLEQRQRANARRVRNRVWRSTFSAPRRGGPARIWRER
jgi:pSer/pThr/pTyr-binding forkhead associated (FHA) protein